MTRSTRRSFLVSSAKSAVAIGVAPAVGTLAQTIRPTRVVVDPRRVVATLDRRLFG